ncbi:hypothetical protein ACRYJU_07340 [Alloalcanivorax xenomutans]|uniref:hypothetical protein n=1 Tax=Alloalcanivorax xenomutans TaxID=1094342 RepID=UPI003D9B5527
MIVDPDMPDHWKTRMLVDLLGGDELAPLYLIRLWGHCQNRKAWIFDGLPPAAVKAICRFSGDAKALDDALIECGFMERDEKQITVVGWEERNASMVKSWENGKRGGRPKKSPVETEDKPEENPEETQTETQEEPSDNPRETDKRREEKIREDEIPPKPPRGGKQATKVNVTVDHMVLTCSGLSDQLAQEYLAFRKSLKAPLTESAWKNISAEIAKSNASPDDALSEAMAAGWRSFKAQWLENRNAGGRPQGSPDPGPRKELRLD